MYTIVKERTNTNIIRSITSNLGTFCLSKDIATYFGNQFSVLFNNHHSNLSIHYNLLVGTIVSKSHASLLDADIFYDEISSAIRSIDGNKSLGVDGFNSWFFLKSRSIIGPSFLKEVHHFFTHCKILDVFKHSLITLILK